MSLGRKLFEAYLINEEHTDNHVMAPESYCLLCITTIKTLAKD